MTSLKPIKLLPACERVAAALRKAILSCELKEGEELTLDSIANKLQVSNTPIREAFQILARDGLIKLRPNKGAVVLGVNEKTIRDHYEVRSLLESESVYLFCTRKADVQGLRDLHKQAKILLSDGRYADYSNLNQAFHYEIWNKCGNEKIKSILSSMWNGLSIGASVSVEEYAQISFSEHEKLLEAIVAHDAETSKNLMKAHIMRSEENLLTNL